MTRRQFLACLLMALVVLVCLPLVKFTEWGERWFGKAPVSPWGPLPANLSDILKRPYPFGVNNLRFDSMLKKAVTNKWAAVDRKAGFA